MEIRRIGISCKLQNDFSEKRTSQQKGESSTHGKFAKVINLTGPNKQPVVDGCRLMSGQGGVVEVSVDLWDKKTNKLAQWLKGFKNFYVQQSHSSMEHL